MKKKSGFILALILVFLVVLTFMQFGMFAIISPEFFFLTRQKAYITALHVADAGIEDALDQLQSGNFNNFSGSLTPSIPSNSPVLGTYQVTITADPGNAFDTYKMYQVTSYSTLSARTSVHKTVQAVVESISFGDYLYFTDHEYTSDGVRIWFRMGETVDGPMFSNDQVSINWNGYQGNPPIFQTKLTSPYSPNWNPQAPTGTQWDLIFTNGTSGLETGVGNIPFPPPTNVQKLASLGGMTAPTTTGITIPNNAGVANGGIYIQGNAKKILLGMTSSNQTIQITQVISSQNKISTITINPTANTTTLKKPDNSTIVYTGTTNGVIYVNGDIQDLSGTVQSRMSLVTNAANSTTITGNIQLTQDPIANPSFDGMLGLVSGNIILPSTAPSNIIIQAAMIAGQNSTTGSFYYVNYDQSPTKGNLNILGSLSQEVRGKVGTFNPSTGTLSTGYSKNYHFDTRLALRPPPYFPTTGKYRVRFWKKLN